MRHPEQVVAALTARHPDWAVLYGGYSREFVAFPTWCGYAHRQLISAGNPDELEQNMTWVEAASGRANAGSVPSKPFLPMPPQRPPLGRAGPMRGK
jgi:hypothetical protein